MARKFRNFRDALAVVPEGEDRHLLREFNFMNTGQPPSVKMLAESLGFIVDLRALPTGVSGFLEADIVSEKGFRIVVNERHSVTRRRWTVLHEIAHYYLHPDHHELLAGDAFRADADGVEHFYTTEELTEEREANAWVEALVFEANALKSMRSLFKDNYAEIAKRFGVSEAALRIALKRRRL